MRAMLACVVIMLTGCSAYRITRVDNGTLPAPEAGNFSGLKVTKQNKNPQGFQCWEPLLYGLTLGLIPANCVDTYLVSVTSGTGEKTESVYKVSVWAGWVSVLLAPSPQWHWQMGYGYGVNPATQIERRVRGELR